jgi:Protein of unknown function (DUF998)
MIIANRTDMSARPVLTTVKALLGCGAVAGPLFVGMFLIEGATHAGYNPLRHPVSSLALGEYGWTQTVNFIVAGLLTLAFAIGLRIVLRPGRASTWGPLLIGVWAVGLLGAGIFVTDPVSGYPPGTPDVPTTYSTSGRLHDLFSLPAFVALPAACLVFTRRFAGLGERAWASYSAATSIIFVVAFVLAGAGFDQNVSLVDLAGLFQRIAVTSGWAWLTLLAIHTLKPPGPVDWCHDPRDIWSKAIRSGSRCASRLRM